MRKFILFVFFKQVQSTNSWCPNLYGQSEQTLTKIWKTKWPPNYKIEHNSLISWQNFEKQNGRQITKLSITRSFFDLQSPDFAWKFVWTKFWKTKWPPKKNGHKITKLSWYQQRRLLFSQACEIFYSTCRSSKFVTF